LQRSRSLLSHGRQIWRDLLEVSETVTPKDVAKYMKSLYHAVNAVAELSGPPLQERRLMLEFAPGAETAQRPGMDAALTGLMGASSLEPSVIQSWLPDWKLAFESAMETAASTRASILARVNYYEKAIQPCSPAKDPHRLVAVDADLDACRGRTARPCDVDPWRAACGQLGLAAAGIEERVEALDAFLDEVEILLDELAAQYGLETSTSI
jgi:hypothetical protein